MARRFVHLGGQKGGTGGRGEGSWLLLGTGSLFHVSKYVFLKGKTLLCWNLIDVFVKVVQYCTIIYMYVLV